MSNPLSNRRLHTPLLTSGVRPPRVSKEVVLAPVSNQVRNLSRGEGRSAALETPPTAPTVRSGVRVPGPEGSDVGPCGDGGAR